MTTDSYTRSPAGADLADPQPIAVRIVDAEFSHAVEGDVQIRYGQCVPAQLAVILRDVLRIEIEHALTRRVPMDIDRLVHHQTALAEAQHRPAPAVVAVLDGEPELSVELDTRRHAFHRQHRYEAIHFHVMRLPGWVHSDSSSRIPRNATSSRVNA